ncbi:MAG: lysophospholipid acyltransferase family protein [Kiritimatiellia bacterium]
MRNYKEFQSILREYGEYQTVVPEGAKPPSVSQFNSFRYALTVIGLCSRCMIQEVFGKFDYEKWAAYTFSAVVFAEKIRGQLIIEGFQERAAYDGPVVYVSNHMSTLETMLLPVTLLSFNKIAIVLKDTLSENFLMGAAFKRLGCIGVTRKNARQDLQTVLQVGAERLKSGHSVLLFPEGTRQSEFTAKKFNSLGAKLAYRAGVPVVPIAVKTDFLGTGKIIRDFGEVDPSKPIHIACGALLSPELGDKEMHARCVAFVGEKLASWSQEG